jgi:hypothetical protein
VRGGIEMGGINVVPKSGFSAQETLDGEIIDAPTHNPRKIKMELYNDNFQNFKKYSKAVAK